MFEVLRELGVGFAIEGLVAEPAACVFPTVSLELLFSGVGFAAFVVSELELDGRDVLAAARRALFSKLVSTALFKFDVPDVSFILSRTIPLKTLACVSGSSLRPPPATAPTPRARALPHWKPEDFFFFCFGGL